MEDKRYAVTWAFGHLLGLAMPEHYGITGFQKKNLPILPQEFKLLPRQVKEDKEYKNDFGVIKQLKVIRELFYQADGVINCADARREGELIFRYIYQYIRCTLPFQRLWISSLTDRAIKDGFKAILQKEANSKHGFSADKTLTIAQSLYECLHFSTYRTLVTILWEEFSEEINPIQAEGIAIELLSQLIATIQKYNLPDYFADTLEYNQFYTELTGEIEILLENGL